MNSSIEGPDQEQRSIFLLTKDNLDEHNRQDQLCADSDISIQSRRQQFERFKQTSKALGIDLSDPAFSDMWHGLNGMTPMERFIHNPDNVSEAKGASGGNAEGSHP